MKKYKSRLIFCFFGLTIFVCLAGFLNIKVTTKQGINGEVKVINIPLYLKILDFYDRHYNYKQIVERIINLGDNDQERVMKIFAWTYRNIKEQPKELPVIDDHVWHIIVRGYGVNCQFSDVFSVLCNYAGVDAFFSLILSKDKSSEIPLSFVKINNNWSVFDPHKGVYFKDKEGNFADIMCLKSNNWKLFSLGDRPDIDYTEYFKNISSIDEIDLTRSNIQSPLRRFLYEFRKQIKKL